MFCINRALADTDADGKMNLIEFSIACKLISSKLRNVEVPKQLPPTLIASLQHIGTPIRTPTGAMSPTESYKQFLTQQPATVVPMTIQPMVQVQPQPNVMMMSQGMVTTSAIQQQQPPPPIMMMPSNQSFAQQQPAPISIAQVQAIPQPMMMPPQIPPQPLLQQTVIPLQQAAAAVPIQMASVPPLIEQLSSGSLLDNLSQLQSTTIPSSGPLPAAPTPTPPQSGHASRSMSFSEKAPSIPESP